MKHISDHIFLWDLKEISSENIENLSYKITSICSIHRFRKSLRLGWTHTSVELSPHRFSSLLFTLANFHRSRTRLYTFPPHPHNFHNSPPSSAHLHNSLCSHEPPKHLYSAGYTTEPPIVSYRDRYYQKAGYDSNWRAATSLSNSCLSTVFSLEGFLWEKSGNVWGKCDGIRASFDASNVFRDVDSCFTLLWKIRLRFVISLWDVHEFKWAFTHVVIICVTCMYINLNARRNYVNDYN